METLKQITKIILFYLAAGALVIAAMQGFFQVRYLRRRRKEQAHFEEMESLGFHYDKGDEFFYDGDVRVK